MSEISIKIAIANRTYPLKIKSDEEEVVGKAQKAIQEIITDFEKNYAITDKQDLLSMSLIKMATELYKLKDEKESVSGKADEKVTAAIEKIGSYLKSTNVL